MKKLRIVSLTVLMVTSVVSVDLLINFLGNLIPEINDGLGIHSVIFPIQLFWGDGQWSLKGFYDAFAISSLITLIVFTENIALAIIDLARLRRL